MKHIRISGGLADGHGHARRLYRKHCDRGRHTVVVGASDYSNSHRDRRLSACDVLITVHRKDGPLTIEESQ